MKNEQERSNWADYIQDSKSRSSSAMATAENFVEWAGISEGSRVLDLGCGHGRISELMVERVQGLELTGVDMTAHLLDNFAVKTGTNGAKITLMRGDITRLPFGDSIFDAAISSRVFQYLPDPAAGVREAARVLKPGGVLVIAIPNKFNPMKYFTYKHGLYSPFQARDWFLESGLQDVECRSMCFFPSTISGKMVALQFEIAGRVPFLKYFGGSVLVKGRKRVLQGRRSNSYDGDEVLAKDGAMENACG